MAKKQIKEVSETSGYIVVIGFTERGKTRGYQMGETFPRPNDNVADETMKRLLSGKYIEEV